MKPFLIGAIVQHDIEATRHRDDELMQRLVSVTAALGTPWHVIQVIDSFKVERHVPSALHERQITPGIGDLGQKDEAAVADCGPFRHIMPISWMRRAGRHASA